MCVCLFLEITDIFKNFLSLKQVSATYFVHFMFVSPLFLACTFENNTIPSDSLYKDTCTVCRCEKGWLSCRNTCNDRVKAGICPTVYSPSVNENNDTCTDSFDTCINDKSCEGHMKCCHSGCNYECKLPTGTFI